MIKQWLTPVEALEKSFTLADGSENNSLKNTNITPTPLESSDKKGAQARELYKRQGFIIGDIQLMIRYEDGREITELANIYPLPNAPRWFLGFSNLHGSLIPVFDLANFLSVETTDKSLQSSGITRKQSSLMLLVLGHGEASTGIVLEQLPKRMEFEQKDILAGELVPDKLKNLVKEVVIQDGSFWFDLNLSALIKELEDAVSNTKMSVN